MVKQLNNGPWKGGNAGCQDKEKPKSKLLEEMLGKEEKEKGDTKGGTYGFDGFSPQRGSTEGSMAGSVSSMPWTPKPSWWKKKCLRPPGQEVENSFAAF